MSEEEIIRFDSYVSGDMTGEERTRFEKELEFDSELRQRFSEFQEDLQLIRSGRELSKSGISSVEELLELSDNFHRELEQSEESFSKDNIEREADAIREKRWRRRFTTGLVATAAVLALFFVAKSLLPLNDEELVASLLPELQDEISQDYRGPADLEDEIEEAMKLYQQGEMEAFLNGTTLLVESDPRLDIYRGYALLSLGRFAEANELLNKAAGRGFLREKVLLMDCLALFGMKDCGSLELRLNQLNDEFSGNEKFGEKLRQRCGDT